MKNKIFHASCSSSIHEGLLDSQLLNSIESNERLKADLFQFFIEKPGLIFGSKSNLTNVDYDIVLSLLIKSLQNLGITNIEVYLISSAMVKQVIKVSDLFINLDENSSGCNVSLKNDAEQIRIALGRKMKGMVTEKRKKEIQALGGTVRVGNTQKRILLYSSELTLSAWDDLAKSILYLDYQKLFNLVEDENVSIRNRLVGVTHGTRETVYRIGQDVFRNLLLKKYAGQCIITGVKQENYVGKTLLRASHIKPWSVCSDDERLDVNNGLLLVVHHDALFDQGLISFNELGQMIVSQSLVDEKIFGLNREDLPSIILSDEMNQYMAYHREYIFKG